jgi:hypothetical protein
MVEIKPECIEWFFVWKVIEIFLGTTQQIVWPKFQSPSLMTENN